MGSLRSGGIMSYPFLVDAIAELCKEKGCTAMVEYIRQDADTLKINVTVRMPYKPSDIQIKIVRSLDDQE